MASLDRIRAMHGREEFGETSVPSIPSGYTTTDMGKINRLLLSLIDPSCCTAKIPTTELVKSVDLDVLYQADVTGLPQYMLVCSFFRNDLEQFQIWGNAGTLTLPNWIHYQTIKPSRKLGDSYSFQRFVSGILSFRSTTVSSGTFAISGRCTGVYSSDFVDFRTFTSSQLLPLSLDDYAVVPSRTITDGLVFVSDPDNDQKFEPQITNIIQPLGEALTKVYYESNGALIASSTGALWKFLDGADVIFDTELSPTLLPFGLVETTQIDLNVQWPIWTGDSPKCPMLAVQVHYFYEGTEMIITEYIPTSSSGTTPTIPPKQSLERGREMKFLKVLSKEIKLKVSEPLSDTPSDDEFDSKLKKRVKAPTGTASLALSSGTFTVQTPTPVSRIIVSAFDVNTNLAYPVYNAGFKGTMLISNWSLGTQGSESPVGLAIIESVNSTDEITVTGRINYEARPNSTLAKDLKVSFDPDSVLGDIDWAKQVIANKTLYGIRNVYPYGDFETKSSTGFFKELAMRGVHIGKTWSWRDMAGRGAGFIKRTLPAITSVGTSVAQLLQALSSAGEIQTSK